MLYYERELKALKRSNRYRKRELVDEKLIDLASNDYLGLASNKKLFMQSTEALLDGGIFGPKASMLVNGYHKVHYDFERRLCEVNGFEAGVVVGSGFSANMAMIESLLRRGDELFIDEKYHASGMLALKTIEATITPFRHNDMDELHQKLKASNAKRKVIAVEGIYSMDGDRVPKEIFAIADSFEAILIVDEAHSSGVVGSKLMGVFDYYAIAIKPNYIKMGTLGKAYGAFGGYILSSKHINEYLINRAKPIIYATAPSLFDTLFAHNALNYIVEHANALQQEIQQRQALVKELLHVDVDGLIVPIVIGDNAKVMEIAKALKEAGFYVGAIRQPTVERAIVRLIIRLGVNLDDICISLKIINNYL